jgi:hypothetical protein
VCARNSVLGLIRGDGPGAPSASAKLLISSPLVSKPRRPSSVKQVATVVECLTRDSRPKLSTGALRCSLFGLGHYTR